MRTSPGEAGDAGVVRKAGEEGTTTSKRTRKAPKIKGMKGGRRKKEKTRFARLDGELEASELGIPVALASRLTPSMLDELRRAPRKRPTLEEQRKQFEAQRELENFDPLQHDPVEQVRPTRGPQPLAVHPKRGPRLVTDPSPR